jgi:cell division protein FtsI/penicillin-binding protein 2
MKRDASIIRIRVVLGLLLVVAVFFVFRLYMLQIVRGNAYAAQAEDQYTYTSSNLFNRGTIYFTDRDGSHPTAADLNTGYILAINPSLLSNPADTYASLAKIINLDQQDFMSHADRTDDPYEEITDHISIEDTKKIRALGLTGVTLYPERWRNYPAGTLGSNAVGFLAEIDNELTGAGGIELAYDDVLSRSNEEESVNFFAQAFSDIKQRFSSSPSHKEGDVYLTIDPQVQLELERAITATQKEWSSKQTAGIIIDPQTGEILAMAATPGYDPNDISAADPKALFDPLVEGVYEMGSIIKAVTMAAALDAKVVTPNTTYNDTGTVMVSGRRISNYDFVARGVIPMQQILSQSLNVGAVFLQQRLGNQLFTDYLKRFGLFEKSGIDLPGEPNNLVGNLKNGPDVAYATASFGQGAAFTPMSTVRALAALGNGGVLITPHIVSEIRYQDGTVKKINYPKDKLPRAISPATSETVSRMLVTVMDEALAGGDDSLEHHSIALKTGTAQVVNPSGGYYTDRYNHTYFGYLPAYDPHYLIFLMNLEPHGALYASHTLTEPFMDLTNFLISYYNVPPDR